MNKTQNIIHDAIQFLQKELKENLQFEVIHEPQSLLDGYLFLGNKKIGVVGKSQIYPSHISLISQLDLPLLVVAEYITPVAKKQLKENGLFYIDGAGNTWIHTNNIHIHIQGIPNKIPSENQANRAFSKTGLKVVFLFLGDKNLVNASYREIAAKAKVSLGSIPKIFKGLFEKNYLIKKNSKEWILLDYDRLLEEWQLAYNQRLKPSLLLKRFSSSDKDFYKNWKTLTLADGTAWGGEPAANILTQYLKPEVFLLYTNQRIPEIMKQYKWVPKPDGNIWIYERFWGESSLDAIASAILTYADLMETGDSRNIEIAHIIHERFIK
ncbi:MAG: type IV toxin-antitoxin system AbiEi family antitoxin [Bacteroidia bacterium]